MITQTYAEVLTIGDELLIGQTTNTNSQWIGEQLNLIGITPLRMTTVSDQLDEILLALKRAQEKSRIVIITGGLGPTKDDITKKALCSYFDCGMHTDHDRLHEITTYFKERGRPMNALNAQQALIPDAATALPNHNGTAPGMWFEKDNHVVVSLPGVPYEMKMLMSEEVIPRIKAFFNTPIIKNRIIKTVGKGESDLSLIIETWEDSLPEHIKLAYLPSLGEVKLRITCIGDHEDEVDQTLQAKEDELRELIPEYIYGIGQETLAMATGKLLKERNLSISTAESCTGGHLAHQITAVPGSSAYFKGSVIAYSNEIKQQELGVSEEQLTTHGAVSESVVRTMATAIREKFNTSIGLSCSGIAGPDGGTKEKPVGTVWIAIADEKRVISTCFHFGKKRGQNIHLTSQALLNLLRTELIRLYIDE